MHWIWFCKKEHGDVPISFDYDESCWLIVPKKIRCLITFFWFFVDFLRFLKYLLKAACLNLRLKIWWYTLPSIFLERGFFNIQSTAANFGPWRVVLKIDTTDSNEIPFLNRGLEKNPLGNDRKTPNADTKQRNVRENI